MAAIPRAEPPIRQVQALGIPELPLELENGPREQLPHRVNEAKLAPILDLPRRLVIERGVEPELDRELIDRVHRPRFQRHDLPAAPGEVDHAAVAHEELHLRDLLVLVRESAPADWFDGIIDVMGDVVDAILAERTLSGAVKDIYPTSFSPGSISYRGKTFYGGQVTLEGVLFFEP